MNIALNTQQRLFVIILAILTVLALALVTFAAVVHVDLFHMIQSGLGIIPSRP